MILRPSTKLTENTTKPQEILIEMKNTSTLYYYYISKSELELRYEALSVLHEEARDGINFKSFYLRNRVQREYKKERRRERMKEREKDRNLITPQMLQNMFCY